jgi:deazaflavin-dependent oxidoreductase (nitroreductase family)
MDFISNHFLILIIALVAILAALMIRNRLRQAEGMRTRNSDVIDQKRQTNKRKNNRIVMSIGRAGKRLSPFALVNHIGRKTGKPYMTPVRLVQDGNRFIIPLTYGENSDWYQNLRALGRMEILWQGVPYQVGQPECLEVSQAIDKFPGISRFLFWLDGLPALVRVTIIE